MNAVMLPVSASSSQEDVLRLQCVAASVSVAAAVQWLSRPPLRDPMDCSTPGLPVHHQLPELTQTHVH